MNDDAEEKKWRHRDAAGSKTAAARRGVTTLMYACQQGDVESVRRLLRLQPEILDHRDRSGKSALHYCCTTSRKRAAHAADLVRMAAPDLIDGRDEDGFTPLHLAVIAGNMPLVTLLLASQADVNAVDGEKHSVVHWATVCGETEALRAVLGAGAPVSTPDVHGGYPLHYAAQMCGGEKECHLMGMQVLETLLAHSDTSVSVEDGDGRQPLLWAASAGSTKAMLSLIKAGAKPESCDKDGLTALHCAASRGHTDCLDALLTLCGVSVDVIDTNGCTALHYAVTLGHADATALLLAHGANANRQDRKGRSPAHCGCAKGQLETVRMLGAHGANLWLRNARGDLPLHEAAGSGRRDLVKSLLEARPSQVNARNNDGRCPLHLAALNDNADMCKILLDMGALVNPVLRTSKNVFMTPLDCAMQRGFRSTAKYLQLQGGLPANRLSTNAQTGGVSLQIKDDLTVWGGTSTESESEQIEGEDRKKRRSYKRKLAYRIEKTQPVSSEGPKEEKKQVTLKGKKVKSTKIQDKATNKSVSYNNEVKITDSAEKINVTQNGSVVINKDISNKAQSTRLLKEETPQLIKESPKIKELMKNKESPKIKKSKTAKKPADSSQSLEESIKADDKDTSIPKKKLEQGGDINENIREIENLAHSIEQKARSICKEVNNIEDIQSLTSNEEVGVKNLTVEASVHAPLSQEVLYHEVIAGLREELDLLKKEIQMIKSEEEKKIPEIHENDDKKEVLKELKDLLEGRILEIKSTVEEFKDDITSVIKSTDLGKTKDNLEMIDFRKNKDNVEIILDQELSSLNILGDNLVKEKDIRKMIDEKIQQIKEEEIKKNIIKDDQMRKVIDQEIQRNKDEENVVKIEEDDLQKIESDNVKSVKIMDDNLDVILKMKDEDIEQGGIVQNITLEQTEIKEIEEPIKNIIEIKDEITASETKIKDISVDTEISDNNVITKEEIAEVINNVDLETSNSNLIKIEEPAATKQTLKEDANAKQTDSKQNIFGEKITSSHKEKEELEFKKPHRSKRNHHLHIPREEPLESSIEAKSSEEDVASESDASTISSVATKREHKSFTVLEESRHLETKRERLRRSKIPTASAKRRAKSNLESRVPLLPELKSKTKSETNLARIQDYSDQEFEEEGRRRRIRRRVRSKSGRRSPLAASDNESSNLIDSGFEPSPRSSRMPKWKNVSDRGVNMTSVTQSIQGNIRRYHLERKIFQHLLDLKRMQIRAGQHNESMLVKRAIDVYHKSCAATVGAGRYNPQDFTFKSFEKFLYESLRKIQQNVAASYLKGLPEKSHENPMLCTQSTNRCMHAVHAYTGVPCAAYLPKVDHHSIPKIGFNSCKPQGFLPSINTEKKSVTLELCHGNDKQIISLPTDRLDQNKRYYVTFTVKGQSGDSTGSDENQKTTPHRHAKSV